MRWFVFFIFPRKRILIYSDSHFVKNILSDDTKYASNGVTFLHKSYTDIFFPMPLRRCMLWVVTGTASLGQMCLYVYVLIKLQTDKNSFLLYNLPTNKHKYH